MITFTILAVWIICGVLAYGLMQGYFQREFASLTDTHEFVMPLALFMVLLGPAGLLISACAGKGFKHGLLFGRLSDEERLELLKKEYPDRPHMWRF